MPLGSRISTHPPVLTYAVRTRTKRYHTTTTTTTTTGLAGTLEWTAHCYRGGHWTDAAAGQAPDGLLILPEASGRYGLASLSGDEVTASWSRG